MRCRFVQSSTVCVRSPVFHVAKETWIRIEFNFTEEVSDNTTDYEALRLLRLVGFLERDLLQTRCLFGEVMPVGATSEWYGM